MKKQTKDILFLALKLYLQLSLLALLMLMLLTFLVGAKDIFIITWGLIAFVGMSPMLLFGCWRTSNYMMKEPWRFKWWMS